MSAPVTPQLVCIERTMSPKFFISCLVLLLWTASADLQAQVATTSPCSLHSATHDVGQDAKVLWQGIRSVPGNAVQPQNLAWELPIGAATGIMVAKADVPAADRIQSKSLQETSGRWSNVGLGMELGAGALGWSLGCITHHSRMAKAGFTALAATGAAGTLDLALKLGFDRQFPYTPKSTGKFWGGGRSFPSGHSATSFAFASTVAHRYPHKFWIKWGAYALATGVSLSRYPAKKHFPSDILVGATLGYVTGAYFADHTALE